MRFLIADDHPFTLTGTKHFIEELGYENVETAKDGLIAFEKLKQSNIDIFISDINMPQIDGIELLEKIRTLNIPTKVIFLTSHNEMSIYKKASEFGVNGYLLKNFAQEELAQCIQVVLNQGIYLSSRIQNDLVKDKTFIKDELLKNLSFIEVKIFELISKQKSSKEIAELLFLSEKSVEGYRTNIIEKLDLPKERNSLLKFATTFNI